MEFIKITFTSLPCRRKQFLLGCAIVALPFLSFVWNGIWEYRVTIFLALAVFVAALLYCVEWLKSGKTVIGILKLDIAVCVYLIYCTINNLLHDNAGFIEQSFL